MCWYTLNKLNWSILIMNHLLRTFHSIINFFFFQLFPFVWCGNAFLFHTGIGMQGYNRAPLSRNGARLKQYSNFDIILREFSMRFEVLNIYLLLSGRGGLAAACRSVQWERGPQPSRTLGCSLPLGCWHEKSHGAKCFVRWLLGPGCERERVFGTDS